MARSPAMPVALSRATAVYVAHDGIYILGGEDAGGEPVASVLMLELSSGTWSEQPAMPDPAKSSASAMAAGAIYVFGGVGPGDPAGVQVFDLGARAWTAGLAMPSPLADAAAIVLGDDIYLFGGSTPEGGPSALALKLDPTAGSWTRLPDMPAAGTGLSAVVMGSDIWVIGVTAGAYPEIKAALDEERRAAAQPAAKAGMGEVAEAAEPSGAPS